MKRLFLTFSLSLFALLSSLTAQTVPPAQQLTIDAIFADGGLTGRTPETIKWSPDGTKVSYVLRDDSGEHGELWYVDTTTGEKKVLVSEAKLAKLAPPASRIKDEREKERVTRYHVAAYSWSPDSKHLLFDSQGQLWYYDLGTGTGVPLTSSPDASGDPKFSPDGKRLAYVRKHNLYVHPVSGEEGEHQITRDEKEKDKDKDENILNGEVDWVYTEELAVRSNYFWSPEGHDIIFLQMDETRVPTYPITDWIPTHPHVEQEKYPKAGDPNPSVRLGVVSGGGGKPHWITPTADDDFYIPRFGWIREGWAWAEVLNRKQDTLDLYFIDARSGRSRKVLTESEPDAWVNVNDDFRILKSSDVKSNDLKFHDRFLWTSWRDGHTHIYLYSFDKQDPLAADAKLERQLESGDYEVLEIDGVDEQSGTVFFTANKGDARQQQLFSVKLDGSAAQGISTEEGHYSAEFADDGKHYVEHYSNSLQPPQASVCAAGKSCQKIWEGRSVAEYDLVAPKYLDFKADDGTPLYGYLMLPPNADPSQKIPLIVFVYGGPAGQTVMKAWGGTTTLFHQMLAKEGFAIFSLDNRGSPNRGKKFSASLRKQFGGIELNDQLTGLDQLYAQYPQLDRSRTGIWGWSNGGSMTLYALTHSDRFKVGVSVAPVTSQRNYDSIYTERYMGLPKENASGYDNSIVSAAGKLHGSLLLVHGTSDDNVHFQNTIQMTDALIKAGKQFRLMLYPNKTHGIAGPGARTQLFHMMEDFWNKELK
ncbi:MAG: DPP IV N-terminal domain-containing protein [Acidobacteriia bacterium]|nr:DPP IV N-terminal domain-containing protein [Terriglobia bacterium]